MAVVRFPDTSSWVLCLDVGGLDVVRSPRVSFQKRWLLGRRQQPGWAAPRGVAVSTGHGAASLLCPAVQLLLGAPLPPLPSAGSKVAFFLPASDWRPGGFPGASVFGCRPHFQSRICRGPGELPGPRPHCSSLGASPLCCQGPSRLCPGRSCAEAAFGCGGAGPLYTALALSFLASFSAERSQVAGRPCWQGPPTAQTPASAPKVGRLPQARGGTKGVGDRARTRIQDSHIRSRLPSATFL